MVKNLPAMQEAWIQSLGGEDPVEKGMSTHSSILAWRITWTEERGGLQSMGSQRVGHDWVTNTTYAVPGTFYYWHIISAHSMLAGEKWMDKVRICMK